MSIKATWNNLKKGTRVRCIFQGGSVRYMMTGVIEVAKQGVIKSTPNEGSIEVTFDSDSFLDIAWGSLSSFEVVGPLVTWQNIVTDLPVRLVDKDLADEHGIPWGETGKITGIDTNAGHFLFDYGSTTLMTGVSAFEVMLPSCDWTDINEGDIVCCLANSSRQYGCLGTITEYNYGKTQTIAVSYSSGYPLRAIYDKPWNLAKMPSKVQISTGMPAGKITEVMNDAPKPTALGFDWDVYYGEKLIKSQGKLVLDPRGGVRRIKS